MVMSPNRTPRVGKKVRLVVLHTAEGARTTAELGRYFARASTKASSHAGVDDHGLELYVPYEFAAWTLRSGNAQSDNAELCGFAKWTRDEWLTKHRPMLEHAARWVRDRCQARNIPIRKLTPAQVAAGMAGVCGHIDWTVGMKDGDHRDPGREFPWDVVMALASGDSPHANGLPVLRFGDRSDAVKALKAFMLRVFPTYSEFELDDRYDAELRAAVKEFQKRAPVHGSPLNGEIVGPATNYELAKYGYRG